jgi:hypothetical protein
MGFRRYALSLATTLLGFGPDATGRVLAAVFDPKSADVPEYEGLYAKAGKKKRDVPEGERARGVEDGVRSWQRDGFARRIVEVVKFYAIGSNLIEPTATAENETDRKAVQAALDVVWKDPKNRMPSRVQGYYDGLAAMGELCLVLAIGKTSKLTRFGYIDPGEIDDVLTDPDDAQQSVCIVRKPHVLRTERIVHPVLDPLGGVHRLFRVGGTDDGAPLEIGATVQLPVSSSGSTPPAIVPFTVGQPAKFLKINALPNQSRGASDFFVVFHVLEMIDRFLWKFADTANNLRAFAWHVQHPPTLTGKPAEDLLESARAELVPGAGGVLMTTSNVTVTPMAPALNAGDSDTALSLFLKALGTGTGIPAHLFSGEGGEVNLATAGELAGPFIALVQTRQTTVREFFHETMLAALLQKPEFAAMYADDPARLGFDFNFPAVTGKDAVRAVTVLQGVLAAINALKANLGLTWKAAVREAIKAAGEYGVELKEDDFDENKALDLTGLAFPAGARGPAGNVDQNGEKKPGAGPGGDGAGVKPNGQTDDERSAGADGAS